MDSSQVDTSQVDAQAGEFVDALHALESGSPAEAAPLAALFAQEAEINNSALDSKGQTVQGQEEILSFWREYKSTLGQVHSQFHQITTNGNAAGLFWTTQGSNQAGSEVKYHGATLLEFDEAGKITHLRGYYDTRELTVKAE